MDIIEKAAAAMYAEMARRVTPGVPWETEERLLWRELTRIALRAVRKPTKDMCRAASMFPDDEGYGGLSDMDAEVAWEAMIDAALADQ